MTLHGPAMVIALAAIAALPLAAASSASAQPPMAGPGDIITLTYTIPAGALVEARAIDSISCTIEGPARVACANASELVDVRVQGSARSYVFEIAAPEASGDYVARFSRVALVGVGLPPAGAEDGAEARFSVRAPASGNGLGLDAPPADITLGATSEGDGSAGRWLASLFMGSGATVAAVGLARRGAGGS